MRPSGVSPGLEVRPARRRRDREARRHRQAQVGHLGEVGALATQQVLLILVALGEVVDVGAHALHSTTDRAAGAGVAAGVARAAPDRPWPRSRVSRMKEPLRERQEWKFFASLPQADLPLTLAWWCLVVLRSVLPAVFAVATGVIVGAVEDGTSLTAPLALMGVAFVLLQVSAPLHQAVGENLGNRMSAWLYDDLTDSCVAPPGHRPPRGPRAHRRRHRGPGVRRGRVRAADGGQRAVHRGRPGRPRLGTGLGGRAVRLRLVGAAGARRRVAVDALAAAGERGVEGPQHHRGPRGEHPRRLRVPAGRGPAGRQGAAGLRALRLGARPVRSAPPASSSTSSRRRPGCASGRWPSASLLVAAANLAVFGALARGHRVGRAGPGSHDRLRAGGRGHLPDRLRRAQLGPRRGGRPGRRGAAAARGDPSGRRAVPGRRRARPPACPLARSGSATSASPTRAPTARSWPGST